jgi:hypothetical protein
MNNASTTTKQPKQLKVNTYKGYDYYQDNDGLWKVNLDKSGDSVFVIALDDSKLSGKRRMEMQYNTGDKCKEYIDWVTK